MIPIDMARPRDMMSKGFEYHRNLFVEHLRSEVVRAFEEQTDKRVLVLRSYNAQPDELGEEELEELQALERELGYIVIAVK